MWNLKSATAVVLVSLSFFLLVAARPLAQAGNTWTIIYGDPTRSGDHKTTLTISYIDTNGVKQEKSISASVSLGQGDSADGKKGKIEDAMDQELSKPGNTVGGQPIAATGGTGHVMTCTPSGNTGSFSSAKIESVKTEDNQTGEDDTIIKPTGKKGLAHVSPQGELLGQTSDRGPSVFFVKTNLGITSVALTGNMTKLQLLKALKEGLVAQDPNVVAWIDSDLNILFVKLDDGDEGIFSIGAGSTDEGLTATCKVLVTE